MSTRILIDNFAGNASEFYALVVEEIKQRGLPEVEYGWTEEAESDKKFFNKGVKAPSLRVSFKTMVISVFAYQLGACFFVSARMTRQFRDPQQITFLYETFMFTFESVVDRATKRALARHMESRSMPVPSFLAANDNFAQAEQPAS